MILRPVLLATLLAAAATPALAQDYDYARSGYSDERDREIRSVSDFEAPLARFGRWVPSRWGRAWLPNVERDWRPYTVGQWVDGPDGREWQSDEPWGWATYHYGRWGFDERWGWVWVPDTEWAPAWVAFRDGDDVTGWAPLPPQSDYGEVEAWDYTRWYAPSWVYVPRTRFYGGRVNSYVLPWRDNRNYWSRSRRSDDRRPGYGRGPGGDRGQIYRGPGFGRGPDRRDDRPGSVQRPDRDQHDRDRRDGDRRDGDRGRGNFSPGQATPPVVMRPAPVPADPNQPRRSGGGRGQFGGSDGGRPPGGYDGNRPTGGEIGGRRFRDDSAPRGGPRVFVPAINGSAPPPRAAPPQRAAPPPPPTQPAAAPPTAPSAVTAPAARPDRPARGEGNPRRGNDRGERPQRE